MKTLFLVLILISGTCFADSLNDSSIYNLKSEWTATDGSKIQLKSLAGTPVVIAMIYTKCKGSCPLIVSKMQALEHQLHSKVVFALFSIDSAGDSVDELKHFAAMHHLDSNNWRLFSGKEASVRELAAALDFRYKKEANGEFVHSNLITILDATGVIRLQQAGTNFNQDKIVEQINAI